MVKITAALCWYSEPLAFLDRHVRSLAGLVDELIALDGVWEGFEHETTGSRPQEHDAIANACIDTGLAYHVVETKAAWKSQVEKRAKLMELASEDTDWILVMDGDDYLVEFNAAAVHRSLELTGMHVATIKAQRVNELWPKSGLPLRPNAIRRLFRARDEEGNTVTVDVAHNGYRLGQLWLDGDAAYVPRQPALDLSGIIRLEHDADRGDAVRRARSRAYYKARQKSRIESWR